MRLGFRYRFESVVCCVLLFSLSSHATAQTIVDGKRGWAGGNGTQADAANSYWYYNWWHTKPAGADAANSDWIPLVKYTNNLANKLATVTGYSDVDTILVLNEPERSTQSDVTVTEAISIWPQFEATGLNLITPGISDDPNGRAWIDDFMTQANNNNYRMDGFAFHWYGASTPNNPTGAANNLLSRVDHFWNTYGLPIWLTEFAIHDWGGNYTDQEIMDANEQFLDVVVPALESRSYVEAYSFYNWFDDSTIIEDVGGLWTPTNVGDAYIPSYTAGETLDISGVDQEDDTIYLRGATITNTTSALDEAIRYIYAIEGTNQLTGSADWGTDPGGWVEVNAGATLEKSGGNTVKFKGTPLGNRGTFRHAAGTLSLEGGVSVSGSGAFHLEAGSTLSMGTSPDRDGASINQSLELHGGTIQVNPITDGVHTINGTTTVHSTTNFSGSGLLIVIGPLVAPGGGGGGGLVKKGSGTLNLAANNTYEGNTLIESGTLQLSASGQISSSPEIQVKPSGTLNVNGHAGGYTLQGQELKLEGQVAGSINAESGSTVTVLDSNSSISGNLTISGSTLSIGGAGFTESAPGPDIVSTGLHLNFDAADDTAGDAVWTDSQNGQSLSFGGTATPVAINDVAVPGISAAYHIPTSGGADGLNGYFENGGPRSLQDATFEMWFHVDSTASSDDQVLFEAGGAGRGVSVLLNDSLLSFNANGDDTVTSTLSQTIGTGWHHVVGVIDLVGNNDNLANDSMSLYVNNTLVGTLDNLLIDDWSGGNLTGLGDVADSLGAGGTPQAYHDSVAILRYYQNHALDPNEVSQNFQAVAGSETMLPTTMQLGGDYDQLSDAILELDLLDTTNHDSLSITGAAALAGTLDVGEISGFSPSAGDSFAILSALGGVTGQFDTLSLPALSGLQWYVDYAATEVSLNVIFGADFDGSGLVDGLDFLVLQRGFGLTGQLDNSNGDADGNGVVDQFDLQIWEAQFGTNPALSTVAVSLVPEPSALAMLCLGCVTILRRDSLRR